MNVAALVMAYGTPAGPEDVEAFYTDIRRGRPPSAEQLGELTARYAAIGGVSPMNERVAAQVRALARALDELDPGAFRTCYGAKHAAPKIEEAVVTAVRAGASAIVGLVLAPHFSRLGVGEYLARASEAAGASGVPSAFLERWWDEPAFVEAMAARVRAAMQRVGAGGSSPYVLFSAHSLPARVLDEGDPYAAELAASAGLVARAAGVDHFGTCWQSAGRTGEAWLGPDVVERLRELRNDGVGSVVVCPIGFTSDHLEILYDLDVVAAAAASELGLAFARTESLNDDPGVFAALARRLLSLREHLEAGR